MKLYKPKSQEEQGKDYRRRLLKIMRLQLKPIKAIKPLPNQRELFK